VLDEHRFGYDGRAPPGPASRATVAARCRKRTARLHTAQSDKIAPRARISNESWNSPWTGSDELRTLGVDVP
jgi:hypothetical protein